MGNKGPVQYRQYTDEFRVEAVRLSESVGVSTAAKRLGIPDGSLRNWIKRGRIAKFVTTERPLPISMRGGLPTEQAGRASGQRPTSRQASGGSIALEISPDSRVRVRFTPQRATGAADSSARV